MIFITTNDTNENRNLEESIALLLKMPKDLQEIILKVIDNFSREYQYSQLSHEQKMQYEDFMDQLTRDSDYSDRLMIS